jgi:hypothetical protein
VCLVNRDDWDERIPIVLWPNLITCKILMKNTPFDLVYGREAVMPLEYLKPILCVAIEMIMSSTQ